MRRTNLIDRVPAESEEDTRRARSALREVVVIVLDNIWPKDQKQRSKLTPVRGMSDLYQELKTLTLLATSKVSTRNRHSASPRSSTRPTWLMFIESGSNSSSGPLLTIVASWLTAFFVRFVLRAERNATVIVALVIAALAVSGAIFIIDDMDDLYGGLFRITSVPLVNVLYQSGHLRKACTGRFSRAAKTGAPTLSDNG